MTRISASDPLCKRCRIKHSHTHTVKPDFLGGRDSFFEQKLGHLFPLISLQLDDLAHLGFGGEAPVPVEVLNRFDQLHYHGTEALDVASQILSDGRSSRLYRSLVYDAQKANGRRTF